MAGIQKENMNESRKRVCVSSLREDQWLIQIEIYIQWHMGSPRKAKQAKVQT